MDTTTVKCTNSIPLYRNDWLDEITKEDYRMGRYDETANPMIKKEDNNMLSIQLRMNNLELRNSQISSKNKLPIFEIVKFQENRYNEEYCFTQASWIISKEPYEDSQLKFIGSRPFKLTKEDQKDFWELAAIGQKIVDNWNLKENG